MKEKKVKRKVKAEIFIQIAHFHECFDWFSLNYHKYIELQRNRFILCAVVLYLQTTQNIQLNEWISVCEYLCDYKAGDVLHFYVQKKYCFLDWICIENAPLNWCIEMCKNEYRINYNVLFEFLVLFLYNKYPAIYLHFTWHLTGIQLLSSTMKSLQFRWLWMM